MKNINDELTELDPPKDPKEPQDKIFWTIATIAFIIVVLGTYYVIITG